MVTIILVFFGNTPKVRKKKDGHFEGSWFLNRKISSVYKKVVCFWLLRGFLNLSSEYLVGNLSVFLDFELFRLKFHVVSDSTAVLIYFRAPHIHLVENIA